jgi:hypothetical protein
MAPSGEIGRGIITVHMERLDDQGKTPGSEIDTDGWQ